MPFRRGVSLAVVSGVAGAWAGAMVMCGLWVMYSVPIRWSVQHRHLCDLVGIGLVAGVVWRGWGHAAAAPLARAMRPARPKARAVTVLLLLRRTMTRIPVR